MDSLNLKRAFKAKWHGLGQFGQLGFVQASLSEGLISPVRFLWNENIYQANPRTNRRLENEFILLFFLWLLSKNCARMKKYMEFYRLAPIQWLLLHLNPIFDDIYLIWEVIRKYFLNECKVQIEECIHWIEANYLNGLAMMMARLPSLMAMARQNVWLLLTHFSHRCCRDPPPECSGSLVGYSGK